MAANPNGGGGRGGKSPPTSQLRRRQVHPSTPRQKNHTQPSQLPQHLDFAPPLLSDRTTTAETYTYSPSSRFASLLTLPLRPAISVVPVTRKSCAHPPRLSREASLSSSSPSPSLSLPSRILHLSFPIPPRSSPAPLRLGETDAQITPPPPRDIFCPSILSSAARCCCRTSAEPQSLSRPIGAGTPPQGIAPSSATPTAPGTRSR